MFGTHVGQMICQFIGDNKIDAVLLGSKGLGGLAQRLFGTTSRYVFENSTCDCIVIKSEHFPKEVHVDKAAVLLAEEKERKRRMESPEETLEKHKLASTLSENLVLQEGFKKSE